MPEPSSDLNAIKQAEIRLVGRHVVGHWLLNQPGAEAVRFMGFNVIASDSVQSMPSGPCRKDLETFTPSFSNYCYVPKLMPANGTWIVADELTGKPGRGVSLDVQGDKMVMQMFGYRADGAPSFYMGSGLYESGREADQYRSVVSSGVAQLHRYAGGRSLGGAVQSATEVDAVGEVHVRISQLAEPMLTSGTVQFPGEPEKRLIRLSLQDTGDLRARLLGLWHFSFWDGTDRIDQLVRLSRKDGDAVTNDDGSIRCIMEANLRVACLWYASDRKTVKHVEYLESNASFLPIRSDNVRLSDQFDNLLGLGDAPMR